MYSLPFCWRCPETSVAIHFDRFRLRFSLKFQAELGLATEVLGIAPRALDPQPLAFGPPPRPFDLRSRVFGPRTSLCPCNRGKLSQRGDSFVEG
jgi:hypothetical protein